MPPRWPSTWRPENGPNWRKPFGPRSPSARADAAAGCIRSAATPSTTAPSARAPRGWPTTSRSRPPPTPAARPATAGCSCAIAYDTRHRSRQFAELVQRDHGGRRLHGLLPRRLPQHAGAFLRRAPQAVRLRHHDHRQPQPAQRQRGEGLRPQRRAVRAAARRRLDRPRCSRSRGSSGRRLPRRWPPARSSIARRRSTPRSSRPCWPRAFPARANLKILYSPLHGVGASAVYPVLDEAGFRDVEIFGPHAEPDGDFPNVPKHVANPENPAVFDAMIERAKQSGAELILATDPDCDRLGCAVRQSLDRDAPWATLTGNQLGSLLVDFLLGTRQAAGTLTPRALRRQDAGDHRTDPPHRRPLRRADGRQSARGLQVDRRRDGRPRAGGVRLRRGGVVRVPGRRPRPRQGRRRGLAADGRTGRPAQGRRQDALPAARRVVPPIRLLHRGADQRPDAGREGDGGHAGADGPAPRRAARAPRRPEGGRGSATISTARQKTVSGTVSPLDAPRRATW